MSALLILAKSLSFSKGSKMETVLKSENPTDKQIADAALKPATASEAKAEKPEAKKATTNRGGEYR